MVFDFQGILYQEPSTVQAVWKFPNCFSSLSHFQITDYSPCWLQTEIKKMSYNTHVIQAQMQYNQTLVDRLESLRLVTQTKNNRLVKSSTTDCNQDIATLVALEDSHSTQVSVSKPWL